MVEGASADATQFGKNNFEGFSKERPAKDNKLKDISIVLQKCWRKKSVIKIYFYYFL